MKILTLSTSLFLVIVLVAAATVSNSGTLYAQTLDTDEDVTTEEGPTEEEEIITEVPTDEPLTEEEGPLTEVPTDEPLTEVPTDEPLTEVPPTTDEPLTEVPEQPGPTGTIVNDTAAIPDICDIIQFDWCTDLECPPNCLIIASPTDIQQGNFASIELTDTVNETLTVAGQSRQVPTIQSQLIIGTPEQIVSIALDEIRTTETNQTRIAELEQLLPQVVNATVVLPGLETDPQAPLPLEFVLPQPERRPPFEVEMVLTCDDDTLPFVIGYRFTFDPTTYEPIKVPIIGCKLLPPPCEWGPPGWSPGIGWRCPDPPISVEDPVF